MPFEDNAFAQFANDLRSRATDGKMPVPGQTKRKPRYWIEVTSGMSGFFAIMLWDGMGFPEPWETGQGRYRDEADATKEACAWAAKEKLEFVG